MINLTMKSKEPALVSADGTFEVTFVGDSAPGVFLPLTTVVKGQMSPSAFRRYLSAEISMSAKELDNFVCSAVRRRFEREGARNKPITVMTTDFR